MKRIFASLLVLMLGFANASFANADLQSKLETRSKTLNEFQTQNLVLDTNTKAISLGKASKKLIGVWDVVDPDDASIDLLINIKSVGKSDLGFSFVFDTLSLSSGNVIDANLKGFVQGNRLFFATPALGITLFHAYKLAKGLVSGAGELIAITDLDCDFTNDPGTCGIRTNTLIGVNKRLFIKE